MEHVNEMCKMAFSCKLVESRRCCRKASAAGIGTRLPNL
jgi:hypothetical protein